MDRSIQPLIDGDGLFVQQIRFPVFPLGQRDGFCNMQSRGERTTAGNTSRKGGSAN